MSIFDFESKIDGIPISEYMALEKEKEEKEKKEKEKDPPVNNNSGATKYCRECGGEIKEKAVICIHCGCATGYKEKEVKEEREYNKWIAIGLCLFFGLIGVHRFYVDEYKSCLLMLVAFVFGWWLMLPFFVVLLVALYDLINMCVNDELAGKKLIK